MKKVKVHALAAVMASVKPVEDGDTESRPPSDASAAVPTEKEKEMLEAFRMIDQDNSGHITARELGIVLRVGGSKIKDKDVKQAIMMLDPGGDGSITFEEFKQIVKEGGGLDDYLATFRQQAQVFHSKALQEAATPLFQKLKMGVNPHDKIATTRFYIAELLDGHRTQMFLLSLVVLDVLFVIMELMISAMPCPCKARYKEEAGEESTDEESTGRRLLLRATRKLVTPSPLWPDADGGGRRLEESGDPFARENLEEVCEELDEAYHTKTQDDIEYALHCASLTILLVFAAQIGSLMFAYGPSFWREPAYVFDTVVVGVALLLDMHLKLPIARIGVVVLFWRVLRVVHGLYITYEHHHNNFSHKKEDEREHAHSEHVHGASDRHIKSHQAESAGSAAAGDDGTQ